MLFEFISKLFNDGNLYDNKNDNIRTKNVKRQNVGYSTSTIVTKNSNIVYPDNKTEKEIEVLYSEIRELQAKNREIIEKNKFSYPVK